MQKIRLFRNPLKGFSFFFLGRAFIIIWLELAYYDMFSSIEPLETQLGNVVRGVLTFIVGLILIKAGDRISEKLLSNLVVASIVLLTIASGCMVIYFGATEPVNSSGLLVQFSYITSEIGIILPQAIWIKVYVRMRPSHAIAALLLSSSIGAILCLIMTPIPKVYISAVFLFLPVLSHICYLTSRKKLADAPEKTSKGVLPYDAEPQSTFIKLLVMLACISMALGLALGYYSGETNIFSMHFTALNQILVASISLIILFVILFYRRAISLPLFCAIVAALMVVGLSIFLVSTNASYQLGSSFIIGARSLLLSFIWITICDISRHTNKKALVVFLIPYGVYLVSHFAARVASGWIAELSYGETLLLISAASLMSFSFILLFSQQNPKTRPLFERVSVTKTEPSQAIVSDSEPQTPTQSAHLRALDLASEYHLSERESEIAVMVSKGRSRPYIANKLHLSENTVRNYTRTIYQKMNVSSKQELIDLLE